MDGDLGKKLVSNLSSAFEIDKEIDEYDFLPIVQPEQNKNPIVVVQHKLGIEMWALKPMFNYAYSTIVSWRRKELRDLDAQDLIDLSRAALMINFDCALMWNVRKEMVEDGSLTLSEDLYFSSLVLTKHPKSPETFFHRKWLLRRWHVESKTINVSGATSGGCDVNSGATSGGCDVNSPEYLTDAVNDSHRNHQSLSPDLLKMVNQEMLICKAAAGRYSNNYNAWSHRIWLLQTLANCDQQLVLDELTCSNSWVKVHISDYSGFQYRQFLYQVLQNVWSSHEWSDKLDKEVEMISELIELYPGHEALWNHRRFCIMGLTERYDSHKTGTNHEARENKRIRLTSVNSDIVNTEMSFCSKLKESCLDKWQETLITRHCDWLTRSIV